MLLTLTAALIALAAISVPGADATVKPLAGEAVHGPARRAERASRSLPKLLPARESSPRRT